MARRITDEQERLLESVRVARRARTVARTQAEDEARRMIRDRMRAAELVESRAVRAALEGGLSLRRVGLEGLGTSDFSTVKRVLAVTDAEEQAELAVHDNRLRVATPAERRKLGVGRDDLVIRVDWSGFIGAEGEPVDLAGFVSPTPEGGWMALADDHDDEGYPGSGPLWFYARTAEALHVRFDVIHNEVAA